MMTKTHSHYESLNVTPDAPTEVIRAAYRSLSQKHHPDKNVGNHQAAQMMMRLNAAYSVLSDAEQRELYDLQLMSEHRAMGIPVGKAALLLHHVRHRVKNWDKRIVTVMLCGLSAVLIPASWLIWRDNQSVLQIDQGMIHPADTTAAPDDGWPPIGAPADKAKHVGVIQITGSSGLVAATPDQPAPEAAPKAPAAPPAPKESELARLTSMLKGMGLGLHKLELPSLASNAKPAPAKPVDTAKPAKAAEPAKASAAPSAPEQPAVALASVEPARLREEPARSAAPEPVRSEAKAVADTSRASAAPVASAASHAPRSALIAEARSCTAPAYPVNSFRNGETGTVLLALLVGNDGRVIESKVQKSSGWPDLDKAARKALALCKFKPADSQGEPAWANLAYVWSID
jgi:TonB family protein